MTEFSAALKAICLCLWTLHGPRLTPGLHSENLASVAAYAGLPSCKSARGNHSSGNRGRGLRRWRTIVAVTFRTEPVS